MTLPDCTEDEDETVMPGQSVEFSRLLFDDGSFWLWASGTLGLFSGLVSSAQLIKMKRQGCE